MVALAGMGFLFIILTIGYGLIISAIIGLIVCKKIEKKNKKKSKLLFKILLWILLSIGSVVIALPLHYFKLVIPQLCWGE